MADPRDRDHDCYTSALFSYPEFDCTVWRRVPDDVRGHLLVAFGNLAEDARSTVPLLRRGLDGDLPTSRSINWFETWIDPWIEASAAPSAYAEALGLIGGDSAVELLKRLHRDGDWQVAGEAASALRRLGMLPPDSE